MTTAGTKPRERHRKWEVSAGSFVESWFEREGGAVEFFFKNVFPDASGSGSSRWKSCSKSDCLGEAISSLTTCLVHSTYEERRVYLERAAEGHDLVTLRGVSLTGALWDEIVSSSVFSRGTLLVSISFTGTEIDCPIAFRNVSTGHHLDFVGASTNKTITFETCSISSSLDARYATFSGPLVCRETTFNNDVDFSHTFQKGVSLAFEDCTFNGDLSANGIVGSVILSKSTIAGDLSLRRSQAYLKMSNAKLAGLFDMKNATLSALNAPGAMFDGAIAIGPCNVESVNLRGATFRSRVRMDVITRTIDLSGAAFPGGGLLEIQNAEIHLDQVSIGRPLRIAGKLSPDDYPEIVSLTNADASQLSLARVNLSRCLLYGALGLSGMDIEPTVIFPKSKWWLGRRYIADEFAWRSKSFAWRRWGLNLVGVRVGLEPAPVRMGKKTDVILPPLAASQVAATYRELRRSLESKSDMPGASDFYYGEMEMRRLGEDTPLFERIVLTLYCLWSGYGLRAHRALVAWFACVVLGVYGVSFGGFAKDEFSVPRGAIFALRAAIPGVTTVEVLNKEGQLVEAGLRIFGSISIALFLISIRTKLMRKPGE